jgi:hypothetical protein
MSHGPVDVQVDEAGQQRLALRIHFLHFGSGWNDRSLTEADRADLSISHQQPAHLPGMLRGEQAGVVNEQT